jgi:hypothetical protein
MVFSEDAMAVGKKGDKEEMVHEVFLALAKKWDVHDRATGRNLAKHCVEIVDGYYELMDTVYASKKPEKPA